VKDRRGKYVFSRSGLQKEGVSIRKGHMSMNKVDVFCIHICNKIIKPIEIVLRRGGRR
jgi:hypothetical protein